MSDTSTIDPVFGLTLHFLVCFITVQYIMYSHLSQCANAGKDPSIWCSSFFLHCTHLILRTTESIISPRNDFIAEKERKKKFSGFSEGPRREEMEGGQFNYVRVHLNHPAEQVAELKRWRPTV